MPCVVTVTLWQGCTIVHECIIIMQHAWLQQLALISIDIVTKKMHCDHVARSVNEQQLSEVTLYYLQSAIIIYIYNTCTK